MGTKRWQLEEKEKEVAKLKLQLQAAVEGLDQIAEFLEKMSDGQKFIKRAKTKIKGFETG